MVLVKVELFVFVVLVFGLLGVFVLFILLIEGNGVVVVILFKFNNKRNLERYLNFYLNNN